MCILHTPELWVAGAFGCKSEGEIGRNWGLQPEPDPMHAAGSGGEKASKGKSSPPIHPLYSLSATRKAMKINAPQNRNWTIISKVFFLFHLLCNFLSFQSPPQHWYKCRRKWKDLDLFFAEMFFMKKMREDLPNTPRPVPSSSFQIANLLYTQTTDWSKATYVCTVGYSIKSQYRLFSS